MKVISLLAVVSLCLTACATTIPINQFHEVKQADGTVRDEAVVNGRVYYVPAGHKVCNDLVHCHFPEYCGFVGVNTVPVCKQ
jgi:hypothetical protein